MKLFNKILIANRGEIAVRIIKTLKTLGINSVAVFSEKDRDALHTRMADEAFLIKGSSLRETYLNIEKIIEIAKETGAEAIHPGYGFLSENAEFSRKTSEAGINFIGPTPELIAMMGDKLEARSAARNAGVPLIPGFEGKVEDLLDNKDQLEFPVIVKAAAGGGGKAMRIVRNPEAFNEALEVTRRESYNYFGDDTLYVEKYFDRGRHIEIQVIADHYGNILIAGERECTVQRRYQKVIEETPSISLSEQTREKMYEVSRSIIREISYVNAGTLEFLMDEKENFYFLEMNTRIQVEHPVTEQTFGLDIVKMQITIAAGNEIDMSGYRLSPLGHSIEARIYAEDPSKDFLPSPGTIYQYSEPRFPSLRIDSALDGPATIHPDFDPMISKVIVTEATREEALISLQKALKTYKITGLATNREFIVSLLTNEDFKTNKISTTWLEKERESILKHQESERKKIKPINIFSAWLLKVLNENESSDSGVWKKIGYWRNCMRKSFLFENQQIDLWIIEKKKDFIKFSLNDEVHELVLQSLSNDKIIFHIDDEWICASVVTGKNIEDIIFLNGYEFRLKPMDYLSQSPVLKEGVAGDSGGPKTIRSPLHGKIVKLNAILNQEVKRGELLFTLDAMKIENKVVSPYRGCISDIRIKEGEQVSIDQEILVINECTDDN